MLPLRDALTTYRRLVIETIIVFGILAAMTGFAIYYAWSNYLSFYDLVAHYWTWDWSYFYNMVLGVFFTGLLLGMLWLAFSMIQRERKEYLRGVERQKLKEEIKKELEMERQKEKA
jgi:hypothetical protein